jgi:hypothetical protein
MKQYVCKIDNAKFDNMEALIDHIKANYVIEESIDGKASDVFVKLKRAFPEAKINVFEQDGLVRVLMNFEEYGAEFDFKIVDHNSEHSSINYYDITYDSVQKAIENYQWILEEKDKIVQGIKDLFGIEDVKVTQIFQDEPCGNNDSISLTFVLNGQVINERYDFDGVERFLKQLQGHILNAVEGECDYDYGHYESKNTIFIDGVDIRDLARRAKRMRVEILETR